MREEGDSLRVSIPHLRDLPAAGVTPCRWRYVAQSSSIAPDPNRLYPLKRVELHNWPVKPPNGDR